jgi:hypothetical protein
MLALVVVVFVVVVWCWGKMEIEEEGREEGEGGGRKLGGWEEIDRCGVLSERVNFNPKGIAEDRLRNEGWAPAAASLRRLHSGFTPALERGGRQNIKGMEMICPAAV